MDDLSDIFVPILGIWFFKGRERIKFIVGFFLHENYFENNNFTLVC